MGEEWGEWAHPFSSPPPSSFEEGEVVNCNSFGEALCRAMDGINSLLVQKWPAINDTLTSLARVVGVGARHFVGCCHRGLMSTLHFSSAAYFLLFWCTFLSITDLRCLFYVLLGLGGICLAGPLLGIASMVFMIVILGALLLWTHGSFCLTSVLLLISGSIIRVKHTKFAILITTIYAMYCAKVSGGWLGVCLCLIVACMSNEVLIYLCTAVPVQKEAKSNSEQSKTSEKKNSSSKNSPSNSTNTNHTPEESRKSKNRKSKWKSEDNIFVQRNEKAFVQRSEKAFVQRSEKAFVQRSEKAPVKIDKTIPVLSEEVLNISRCLDHYEIFGFSRYQTIDINVLKRIYKKKAMFVHPDKNMGNPMAEESFKKLQTAYQVLSDLAKKSSYDEELRKKERRSLSQNRQIHTQNVMKCQSDIRQTDFHTCSTSWTEFMNEDIGKGYSYNHGSFTTHMNAYSEEEGLFIWLDNFMTKGDLGFPDIVFDQLGRHKSYARGHL